MLTRWLLTLLAWTGRWPLPLVRAAGALLGVLLWAVVPARRRVVRINLTLCFPQMGCWQRRRLGLRVFVRFAQAWLDRGWLWHGSGALLRSRICLTGDMEALSGDDPVVIFAPHFFGLDAAWTGLTQQLPRPFSTIYTDQANRDADAWILRGRQRFANGRLFGRIDGVKAIVSGLKSGEALYLLPDMNFGPEDSVFVPFFGVPAATVPSLSRFARLGRARVVPVVTRMTKVGYEVQVMPAWKDFPSADPVADTARMNAELERYIETMPEQYYWVHKRFKDRPAGEAPPY
ncbi:MAG: lipid A biosynthesis acyltransferase [Rhodoferax sp.]|nr:lipid A biosynthesis acyltransferase [Rhodoferax sp.]